MEKYLLVGLILKDASAIDKITEIERIYFNLDKSLRFDRLLFRVTHFRVLELRSLSLLDISISEYCTGDFDIYGVGKCIRDYYNKLSEDWETIKSIKLNVNCLTKPDILNCKSDDEIDDYLKHNNVPVIYDNKPVYGSSLVKLTDCSSFTMGYNIRLYLYVDYIKGDVSVYLEEILVLGNDIGKLDTIYNVTSKWRDGKGLIGIDHVNELLIFGFNAFDGYVSNGDTAIIYNFKASPTIIIPSTVTSVIICNRWVVHSDVDCRIVLPPKARLKASMGFEFGSKYNNNVVLMVSNELSLKDLEDMAIALGFCNLDFKSKEEIADIIRNRLNISLEFY